jgi:FKBP-type peptidyl-prolyl cis-trans isomerase FklB
MKLLLTAALAALLILPVTRAGETESDAADAQEHTPAISDKETLSYADKISYAFGQIAGRNLLNQGEKLNPELVVRGVRDALSRTETPFMSVQEITQTLSVFQARKKEKQRAQDEAGKAEAEKNKAAGEAFLAANAKKPGVKVLPGGLQYKILKEGTGRKPTAEDSVTVHYRGTLIDGTEFDSSYKRGQPASFALKQVIRGWTEGLQLMKEGAKWQLFIPSGLGYGERGAGDKIGPNAVLVFEVELISID